MKKIVFIHLFNDRSGSPKVLAQVIKAYRKNKVPTELITSKHENGFLTDSADSTRYSFYRRSEIKALTLFYFLISQCHVFFLCLRYLNQDVTLYVNTMMPFSVGIIGRILRKTVIFHVHETSVKPNALKCLLRFVINITAHKVIFVSEYVSNAEHFTNPKQTVIYNAIETPPRISSIKMMQAKGGTFNPLMVCSLKKYKGVIEFITLAQITSQMRFTLVLNASDKEIDQIFKDWDVKLPPNLDVFSRQKDLSGFYSNSSVVLNLSRPDTCVETFGLTILEAMSYGKPVIVPPVGGPVEIVNNGEHGFCISCYDLNTVKDALIKLSCNKQLYSAMSKSALERSKSFSLEKFEHNILKILD